MVLEDGAAHAVDSSELAFKIATLNAFKEAYMKSSPVIMEPIMKVDVTAPIEFQGTVIGGINKRKGTIVDTESGEDYFSCVAEVSLNAMFGYASEIRGQSQGKGEFSMEYLRHQKVQPQEQAELIKAHQKKLKDDQK